ncbi:MAG TPA: calcium-binding protein [Azospirillum sp.]
MYTGNGSWVAEGVIVRPSDVGVTAGLPVADATAVQLADGSVRMYVFAQNVGIKSLIAKDGVHFTAEDGIRLPDGSGMPRVMEMAGGGYRLYYNGGEGIRSATSPDGLTFTAESGTRLTYAATGGEITTPSIVTAVGGYRAYYSDLPKPGEVKLHAVNSASSADGQTFAVEGGVRVGSGSALPHSAEHPDAEVNPDGSVTLFYGNSQGPMTQGGATVVYTSTSADGLTFTQATSTGLAGNDPYALQMSDGTLRLYYGNFDPAVGGYILSARFVEAVAATATTGADRIDCTGNSNSVSALRGNDTLLGGGGADELYGNQGSDLLSGELGADSLFGGQDADTVDGGAGHDVLYGNLADDLMSGGAGDDTLFGGQGADRLLGDVGDDALFGNLGDDTLDGGAGDDALAGGGGADRFVVGGGSGNDTIAGFDAAEGDRVALSGTGGWTVAADASGQAVVRLATGETVTLAGVPAAQVTADWFTSA